MPARGLGPRPDYTVPRGPRTPVLAQALSPDAMNLAGQDFAAPIADAAIDRATDERIERHERRMTGG